MTLAHQVWLRFSRGWLRGALSELVVLVAVAALACSAPTLPGDGESPGPAVAGSADRGASHPGAGNEASQPPVASFTPRDEVQESRPRPTSAGAGTPPAGGGPAVEAHEMWPPRCLAPNYHLHGFPGLDLLYEPRGVQTALQWSPDGSEVLFASGPQVFAVAADGSRLVRLIDASGQTYLDKSRYATQAITAVAASADGKRIAYAVCHEYAPDWDNPADPEVARCRRGALLGGVSVEDERNCHERPVVIRDYAAGPVQLTPGEAFEEILLWDRASKSTLRLAGGYAPAWSPDGTRLAFLSWYSDAYDPGPKVGFGYRPRLPGLYVVSTDTWQLQSRVRADITHPPRWSPDGRRLAIVEGFGTRGSLSWVSADGKGRQRLSETHSDPAWSPDGSRIAFSRAEDGTFALYTIAADGTDEQRITSVTVGQDFRGWWDQSVAWSPDGSMLMYGCPTICVVRQDGLRVGWRTLASREGYSAAWSPDGARIAVLSYGWAGNAPGVLFRTAPDGAKPRILVAHDEQHGLLGVGVQVKTAPVDVAGCSAGTAVALAAANAGLVRDCEVLLRARPVLAGSVPAALNWSPERPITEWAGVRVDGTPPRVRGLELGGYDTRTANGRIPAILGQLTQLRELAFLGNLGGTLPSELGELTNLRELRLAGSSLHGPIPPELGRLAQLEHLALRSAFLSGPIPPELGRLTNLQTLLAAGMFLEGPIPPELGQLAELRVLGIGGNRLTGPIPPELGRLTNLTSLGLSHNRLTGPIPHELHALAKLEALHLEENQLTGCVPPELPVVRRAALGLPDCEAAA